MIPCYVIIDLKRRLVLTVFLAFVTGSLMLVGSYAIAPNGLNQVAYGGPGLTDSLYGEEGVTPCEGLAGSGFDESQRVTIPLNQRERELIHLTMEGFLADMQHEKDGVVMASSIERDASFDAHPFGVRAFFLGFFIDEVVPSIQDRVAGSFVSEFDEAAMLESVQNVEFGACERHAVSIAIEKWTVKSGGQMDAHLKICQASNELRDLNACNSFEPLGIAYSSLTKKIEKDQ